MRKFRDIIISGKCNLQCTYCGGFNHTVDISATLERLEEILSKHNPDQSAFRVECLGEIMLYPEIIRYLERKAEQGYVIEVLSNGILAKDVLSKDTRIRTVFSLDGHTVEMNRFRKLSQQQLDKVLDSIFTFGGEIQCVYFRQTVDQINDFIGYLEAGGFQGKLHLFPCIINNEYVSKPLDYEALVKSDLLPPKGYFDNWKQMDVNKIRHNVCDYFKNGYTYFIHLNEIIMVKCDGNVKAKSYTHPFGDEQNYEEFEPCRTCFNHYEYNNIREIVNLP